MQVVDLGFDSEAGEGLWDLRPGRHQHTAGTAGASLEFGRRMLGRMGEKANRLPKMVSSSLGPGVREKAKQVWPQNGSSLNPMVV